MNAPIPPTHTGPGISEEAAPSVLKPGAVSGELLDTILAETAVMTHPENTQAQGRETSMSDTTDSIPPMANAAAAVHPATKQPASEEAESTVLPLSDATTVAHSTAGEQKHQEQAHATIG